MDFILGVVIFSIGITIYYTSVTNIEKEDSRKLQEVSKEAELVTNYLLSEGYPKDWNISTVKIIGILNENDTIDKNKLEYFKNMSKYNYSKATKSRFKLTSDYAVSFKNITGDKIPVYGIDYIGLNNENITIYSPDFSDNNSHIIKYSRIVMYDKEPIIMEVYTWQR